MKRKIVILGYGILGKVMHNMLVDWLGNSVSIEICDNTLGTKPIEDFDLTPDTIVVNCTKTLFDPVGQWHEFKTNNASTKTSVIIENLRNRVDNGDKVVIWRDYDIDRESFQQEENVKQFLGVDCKIFIKKHDQHKVIYEIGTKHRIEMDSPETERIAFMRVLFKQLQLFITSI